VISSADSIHLGQWLREFLVLAGYRYCTADSFHRCPSPIVLGWDQVRLFAAVPKSLYVVRQMKR